MLLDTIEFAAVYRTSNMKGGSTCMKHLLWLVDLAWVGTGILQWSLIVLLSFTDLSVHYLKEVHTFPDDWRGSGWVRTREWGKTLQFSSTLFLCGLPQSPFVSFVSFSCLLYGKRPQSEMYMCRFVRWTFSSLQLLCSCWPQPPTDYPTRNEGQCVPLQCCYCY